jgi:protein SCO1
MLLLSCALLALPLGDKELPQAKYLAFIREAPEFALTNQDGKEVKLSQMKGKVLLVSFVFTTCSGSCPATTHRMANVQQKLKQAGLLAPERLQLLSITLDPKRDTPEVLRSYMKLYDLDPATWSFLTGPADRVEQVIEAWGMWAKPAANGQLDHPSRIFLVDKQGRIREIYNTDLLRADNVVEDIEQLVQESGK